MYFWGADGANRCGAVMNSVDGLGDVNIEMIKTRSIIVVPVS